MGFPDALLMLGAVSTRRALLGHGEASDKRSLDLKQCQERDWAPVRGERGVSRGRVGLSGAIGWSASACQQRSESDCKVTLAMEGEEVCELSRRWRWEALLGDTR